MVARYSIENGVIEDGNFYSGVTLEERDLSKNLVKNINSIIRERGSKECVHSVKEFDNLERGNVVKMKYENNLSENIYLIESVKLEEYINSKVSVWGLSVREFNTRKTKKVSYLHHKSSRGNSIGFFTNEDEEKEFEIKIISDKILVKVCEVENGEELLSRIV